MKEKILIFSITLFTMLSFANGVESITKKREYLFTYDFIIKNIPIDAREVKIWVPYPAENAYQEVKDVSPQDSNIYIKERDTVYGNNILYYSIRSPKGNSLHLQKIYRIKRREFFNKPIVSTGHALVTKGLSDFEVIKYTNVDDFIIISEEVIRLASELTKGKIAVVEKARAFYDYLFTNMTYDKTMPGWGQGDVKRVCLLKRGNCTDFHSFFIALCRASGIAAKFVMGVRLPEKDKTSISDYHCWAEFYDPQYGWIPVDISEAWKDKSRYEYYFGAIDEKRIEFTQGRGIILMPPPQDGEALNYFIFPYVEIDGKRVFDVETTFLRGYEGKKKGGLR